MRTTVPVQMKEWIYWDKQYYLDQITKYMQQNRTNPTIMKVLRSISPQSVPAYLNTFSYKELENSGIDAQVLNDLKKDDAKVTKSFLEIGLVSLDQAYNRNPLTDDDAITLSLSTIRMEVANLISYYNSLSI